MCMSSPKYTPPTPPQQAKAPESPSANKNLAGPQSGLAGSTLMTGNAGVDPNSLKLGKSSLLGG